ncbi:MAG TPA: hypothetical protein DEQ42_05815, partial [Shigella sp.]|nr:hypothetical protein [Escherichia coli]HCC75226.1 hypothetical protein [Shigella sp.]
MNRIYRVIWNCT